MNQQHLTYNLMAAGGRKPVTLRSLVRHLAGCDTEVDIINKSKKKRLILDPKLPLVNLLVISV